MIDRSELRQSARVPRTERVSANIVKALGPLVSAWARESGLLLSVTGVTVSPDMRNARVGVSLLGGAGELSAITSELNAASGEFRHELGALLRMKNLPRLRFVADDSIATSARISELLDVGHRKSTD